MSAGGSEPLLRFSGVRIETSGRWQSEPRTLLEELSFEIGTGELVALVGESGSGKTLAARAILGLLPPGVRQSAGRIELEGRDLTQLSTLELRKVRGAQIGMVFQEPMVSLNPAITIEQQLAEGMRLHRQLPGAEIRRRSVAMLERVRIRDPLHCLKCYPHEFSGGMRQRIMLASVLLLQPKLLIADEPTTALDTLSQREVMELMVELAHDTGAAVLLITHDLGLVASWKMAPPNRYSSTRAILTPSGWWHHYRGAAGISRPCLLRCRPFSKCAGPVSNIRDVPDYSGVQLRGEWCTA
jgi:peptide/nickel transport system ATP-binding protein